MEFRFADIPVADGHIHFTQPHRMDDILSIMETVPLVRANLVSTPNPRTINHNPALIYFKAHHPRRVYISGALDYSRALPAHAKTSLILADQVATLQTIGFDGLKLIEGKPTARKRIPIRLDGPEYEGMWSAMEELAVPAIFHVADPEEFWDEEACPPWAREHGWFYGDGTYPPKEALYAEVDHILARHPRLRLIFAHFYFLSADLERAGRFLDAHPDICLDLTPGSEMYNNLTRTHDATREFFLGYQDRLVYGTDISTWNLERSDRGMAAALGCAWVVRSFLETEGMFKPPPVLAHWLQEDLEGFRGIALPPEALHKIYHANLERLYGRAPALLNRDAALAEVERIADAADAVAEGDGGDNQARWVAETLNAL